MGNRLDSTQDVTNGPVWFVNIYPCPIASGSFKGMGKPSKYTYACGIVDSQGMHRNYSVGVMSGSLFEIVRGGVEPNGILVRLFEAFSLETVSTRTDHEY